MRKKGYIVTILTLVIMTACATNMNSQHKSEGREPIVSIVEESSSGEETSTMPQSDGYIVEPCDFFEEGVYLVKNVEEPPRYGVVDQEGTFIQPLQYSKIERIEDTADFAMTEISTGEDEMGGNDNVKMGCINRAGMTVILPVYSTIEYHRLEKVFQAWGKNTAAIISTTGEVIAQPVPFYDKMWIFYNGVCSVLKDEKFGFLSTDGTLVTDLKYDFTNDFWRKYKDIPYTVAYPTYKVVSDNPEYEGLQMENPLYVLCQYEIILTTGEAIYQSETFFVPSGLITSGEIFHSIIANNRIVIYDTEKLKKQTVDINGYYDLYAKEYREEPLYDVLMWEEDTPYKYVDISELKDAWEEQKAAKKEGEKP